MEIKSLYSLAWAIENYRRTKSEALEAQIQEWVRNHFPSGSGIDMGCYLDLEKSTKYQLAVYVSWHHMDEHGYYCGWTNHTAIIRPSFAGRQYKFFSADYVMQYDHDQKIIEQIYEFYGDDDLEWEKIEWENLPPHIDLDYWGLPEYEEFQEELHDRFESCLERLEF